jgi:hypothetical protein
MSFTLAPQAPSAPRVAAEDHAPAAAPVAVAAEGSRVPVASGLGAAPAGTPAAARTTAQSLKAETDAGAAIPAGKDAAPLEQTAETAGRLFTNAARLAADATSAVPDFGARNGPEIANKSTILHEVDQALGLSKPPAVEYIFVRPLSMVEFGRNSGTGTNPYGHALARYTMPDGTQKVMNIVGAPGRKMVNFLKPEEYLYGTDEFDQGEEQGGVYNRGMFSVRIENLPPERISALDRYYTDLAARSKAGQARFALALAPVLNLLARVMPGSRQWGNCALWTSRGLAAAGLLDSPTMWPKDLWVRLYEKYRAADPANVHVVSYRRVKAAALTYGKPVDSHGFVTPWSFVKSYKYWNLEKFSDVVVEVPDGSRRAQVRPRQ